MEKEDKKEMVCNHCGVEAKQSLGYTPALVVCGNIVCHYETFEKIKEALRMERKGGK